MRNADLHLVVRRIAAGMRRSLARALDPYRPERHYMRGRGPRWHAKNASTSTPLDAAALPVLVRHSTVASRKPGPAAR
jgi:hypothetical protein